MDLVDKPSVVAIVGPTASGKTDLALAIAEALDAEIIACDSRTVYRHMDIGTAKPSPAEQKRIRHHLLDVVEPNENFTVAEFRRLASDAVSEIVARKKLAIVCGGTGFYARALLEGLSMPDVQPQPELRKLFETYAEENGNQALYEKLKSLDAQAASRLNVNDRFRVIRALEVTTVAGKPFSELAQKTDPPYKTIWIGLNTQDRKNLYDTIARRFQEQIKQGLFEEAEMLLKRYGPCRTLTNTVNYKELVPYFEGQAEKDACIAEAVQHNCQLAQKQLIWFRSNQNMNWFLTDTRERQALISEVQSFISKSL